MQLGDILNEQTGLPCVSHPVKFSLIKRTADGVKRYTIQARLYPVSEHDRLESERAAMLGLRKSTEYKKTETGELPPIPADVLLHERVLRFLQKALHCDDEEDTKLIGEKDYLTFRAGIVHEQVNWLWEQYKAFVTKEYSELLPESLSEEAEKNSEADHSERGNS